MKPFTIETPVLRLREKKAFFDYYWYRGAEVVCRNVLTELFQIEQPRRISFLLSSKYSRDAWKMTVSVMAWEDYAFGSDESDDVYFFMCDKFDEPIELASGIGDR